MKLNALIDLWTHGWRGLALAYAIIGVFMIGGFKQARASWRTYLLSPVLAIPTMVVSIFVATALVWMLEHWGKIDFGRGETVVTLAFFAMGGFVGGLYWANRGRPLQHGEKRGALVFDGAQAQRATCKFMKKVRAERSATDHARRMQARQDCTWVCTSSSNCARSAVINSGAGQTIPLTRVE